MGIIWFLFYGLSGSNDNSPQTSINETEIITSEKSIDSRIEAMASRQLTPIDERLDRLTRGETITVEVEETTSLHYPDRDAYLFNFFEDEDKQLKRSAVLLSDNVEDQKYMGKIEKGDVIDVKRIQSGKRYRFIIIGHHKASDFFEAGANDMLWPDQGCEQELSNESEEIKEEKK